MTGIANTFVSARTGVNACRLFTADRSGSVGTRIEFNAFAEFLLISGIAFAREQTGTGTETGGVNVTRTRTRETSIFLVTFRSVTRISVRTDATRGAF